MLWFRASILKPLTFLAIITFVALISMPANGYAKEERASSTTEQTYEKTDSFTRKLDSKIVGIQLEKLGLSDVEIDERIEALSDEELHHFAGQAENIYPGSGIGAVIIFTAIVLAAAYAYIKFTGKRVVIE
ncbi:MAG: PA2779 family protein [Thermodesulfobacteriota bacterium]